MRFLPQPFLRSAFLIAMTLLGTFLLAEDRQNAKSTKLGSISVSQLRVSEKSRASLRKVSALLKNDNVVEARKQLDALLRVAPDYPDAITVRALMKAADGDRAGAIEDLDRAVQLDPNLVNAFYAYGTIYNSLHRHDEALRSLDRCLQLQPGAWLCEFEMGRSWLGKGEYEKALHHTNLAASWGAAAGDPNGLALLRGYALIGLGRYEVGTAELNRYILAQPNTRFAQEARATLARLAAKLKQQPPPARAENLSPSPPSS